MKHMLVIGASSDIALAVLKVFAQHEWTFTLLGRDLPKLKVIACDLEVRSQSSVPYHYFDTSMTKEQIDTLWDKLHSGEAHFDAIFCAVGFLGSQIEAQREYSMMEQILTTNFIGLCYLLERSASYLEERKQGTLMVISSVAGDRGRASNYFYGAAKAGLSTMLSGLRQRLLPANVQVLTILPGFVATKMTQDLELPSSLTASPEQVASDIYRAYVKGKSVLYTKWQWYWIMLVIKWMPEFVFKKLKGL